MTRSEMTAKTRARHERARQLRKSGLSLKAVAARLGSSPASVCRWLAAFDDVPHVRYFTPAEDRELIEALEAVAARLDRTVGSLVARASGLLDYTKKAEERDAQSESHDQGRAEAVGVAEEGQGVQGRASG